MNYGRKITRRQARDQHVPICPNCGALMKRNKQDFACPDCGTGMDADKWKKMSKGDRHWILKG